MSHLLIFATEREASATLYRLDAQRVAKSLYRFSEGHIALSGLGALAASATVWRHAPSHTKIWNLGIAGCLTDDLSLGEVMNVGTVSRFVHTPVHLEPISRQLMESHLPIYSTGLQGPELMTSDFPIHFRSKEWSASLVDMEGYGIADAAERLQLPYQLLKLVSDFGSLQGPALIRTHLDRWSERLADEVEQQILELSLASQPTP